MSAAPFQDDTPDIIADSHRQIIRARATHPDFTTPIQLDPITWRISLDETRTPRVTATLEVPLDTATVALLDPRTGVRVEIDAGYLRPDGTEDVAHRLFDLSLRRARRDRPGDRLTITAYGDESLVIDASPAVTGTVTGVTHAAAIQTLVRQAITPGPRFTVTATGDPVTVEPVLDRWDTIEDLADRLDADVYDRGDRTWVIEPRPVLATTPTHALTAGHGGTIVADSETTTRDEWANYVLTINRWRDAADVDHEIRATAYVSQGAFAVDGPAGRRIERIEREVPTTQAAANLAAAAILRRTLTRAHTRTATALAAWWVRPGHTVTVNDTAELVSAVEFTDDGLMRVATRRPVGEMTTATTTPTGTAPAADPEPPEVDTYVSEWVASSSASYLGSGTKRTNTTDIVQGYAPDTPQNGNQRAIALFTAANSTGDETGATLTAALASGATISRVELGVYLAHSWSGTGGMLRIGSYAGTTIPATFTGGSPYVTTSRIPRGTWRWTNITNPTLIAGLLAGSVRGVTFGPGLNTDHYIRAAGATDPTASRRPRLRITYAK